MRNRLPLSIAVFAAILSVTHLAAETETSSDPYANEPYWYKPGHPVDPAEAAAIKVPRGFRADRILTVPRDMGSWTALGVDSRGRLIAGAQQQAGLFRITLPALDNPLAETKVEKLGGEAARLGWTHGLLYAFNSLYVTVAEENEAGLARGVYRLEDTDGDDQFDRSRLVLPLDGAGEHGPHNVVVAPDGKALVIMCGNGTKLPPDIRRRRPVATNGVERLMPPGFASSPYSPQGWAMRFDPAGGNREVICTGLRNSFDLVYNRAGELFTFDSDMEWDLGAPWYRPTRICELVSGGEFGWRNDNAVWPEYYDDSVAPVVNVGPGSPTGLVFGYDAKFPARYQRALFACDWTFATVYAVFMQPDGAGYRAEVEEFLGGEGFPVVDLVIAHDGAMYVVVGGRRLGSAIYRIRYVGTESVAPVPIDEPVPALRLRRHELERYHGQVDAAAIPAVWGELGNRDRAVRFAARVALESQPVETWREQALGERELAVRLTALLALARQGAASDCAAVLSACAAIDWKGCSSEEKLRALRICELALARGGDATMAARDQLRAELAPQLPDPDVRVTRELSRLVCALGDVTVVDRLLAIMAADKGERQAQGISYFARNPKYGQALRDMLESAPLLERMHHAQMLLWLIDRCTPAQRRTYFELIADAVAHSKGGHSYGEFWGRIREIAVSRSPESERAGLAAIDAAPLSASNGDVVAAPKGPGREWTVALAEKAVTAKFAAQNFANGKAMFSAAGCVACHRIGGNGGSIGPDLSALGQRFTRRDILEAIIEPSRAVSDQYRMVVLHMRDGRTFSGRIVSRDDQLTYIAPNLMRPTLSEALANDEIESQETLPVSTMPSGLVNPLNEDELLDLIAYLISGGNSDHSLFQTVKPSEPEAAQNR